MRKRTFTTVDLVQLPKMDALSAQALGTQVIANASTLSDLPAPVTEALAEVELTLDALNRAVGSRLPVTASADPVRTKLADVVLDARWSGLHDWLGGWAKFRGLPEATTAGSLRDQLFPNGLRFITLAYRREWAESNTRLLIIEERQLEPAIHELGGAKLLEALRAAHQEYGDAQGITTKTGADLSGTTLRDALDRFTDALRGFVIQAKAMVRKNDPSTEELSRQLLAPIQAWETLGAKGRTQEPLAEAPVEELPAIGEPANPPTNTPAPS
jgi:hypothetical protein